MFLSTSSGTELLLQNDDLRSLLRPRRSYKTPVLVGAAILVLLLVSVSIGVAWRSRHHNASEVEHPVMVRLAAADLRFNASAPNSNSSGPALIDFSIRGGKGDDYGELDKI